MRRKSGFSGNFRPLRRRKPANVFSEIEACGTSKHESARMIRQIEVEARETADRKARDILCNVIQRYAGTTMSTSRPSTAVAPPSEGYEGPDNRPGRRAGISAPWKRSNGVDLIIVDTPETVVLSAYSPIRRQVAKMALSAFIQDGRIHPARIERMWSANARAGAETLVRQVGEQGLRSMPARMAFRRKSGCFARPAALPHILFTQNVLR